MEEMVNINGRVFKLTTDRKLTTLERARVISNIRSGRIGDLIVSNQVVSGPSIALQDITIGGIDCKLDPTCPNDFVCTNTMCTPLDAVTVVVTFTNSGDQDGQITPTLLINHADSGIIPSEGATIIVPAGGIATATYVGTTLDPGPNNVCIGDQCTRIHMLYPTYIVPTDMYLVPNDCDEPCNAYVAVTWLNYGDIAGQLTPGIILDGILTTFPTMTLEGGGAISLAFDIFGLAAGTHTIQPSPNGEAYIGTVNVYKVS